MYGRITITVTKKRFLLFTLLVLFIPLCGARVFQWGTQQSPTWKGCRPGASQTPLNPDVVRVNGNDNTDDFRLSYNEYRRRFRKDPHSVFYLDFNHRHHQPPGNDLTGHYRLLQADYFTYRPPKTVKYHRSAAFIYRKHMIEIEVPKGKQRDGKLTAGSFLSDTRNLGSFTIDFWLYPLRLTPLATLFERVGFTDGEYKGIIARIHQKRIQWVFRDFFVLKNAPQKDRLFLTARTPLKEKTWVHTALTYNSQTGKLSLWLNGRINRSVYLVHNRERIARQPYIARFARNLDVNAYICRTAHAVLDEFRIVKTDLSSFDLAPYIKQPGRLFTPIRDSQHYDSILDRIEWTALLPNASVVKIHYRLSNDRFNNQNKTPAYRYARAEGKIIKKTKQGPLYRFSFTPPKGPSRYFRFIQARATLIGTGQGHYSPRLKSLKLHYRASGPPPVPGGLRAREGKKKGVVILTWKRDMVSKHLAGYKVYSGRVSRRYNRVTTLVLSLKDRTVSYRYSGLTPGDLYYFTVSSFDKSPVRHESRQSKEIYFRLPE
jgi:hypothetical protein